jgi:hypothetical protein
MDELLAEDFMVSEEYVKLIFDNEKLSRSRKYFWAVRCLDEFLISISDNIKQWDLFFEARIRPALRSSGKSGKPIAGEMFKKARINSLQSHQSWRRELSVFMSSTDEAKRLVGALSELRQRFREKLNVVQELRNGVSFWGLDMHGQLSNAILLAIQRQCPCGEPFCD